MQTSPTLDRPVTTNLDQKKEDPLVIFARNFDRPIQIGEEVSIPVECRGTDRTTGRPRTRYAAKELLRELTRTR
jgi:hypothetical protein